MSMFDGSVWADEDNLGADLASTDSGKGAELVARLQADSMFGLVSLPAPTTDGFGVELRAFYSGTDAGGGRFYWDADRNKSSANGGTIIDPITIGTLSATSLGTFLSVQGTGSGTGCWVRSDVACSVQCEWFGLRAANTPSDNNKILKSVLAYIRSRITPAEIWKTGTLSLHFPVGIFQFDEIDVFNVDGLHGLTVRGSGQRATILKFINTTPDAHFISQGQSASNAGDTTRLAHGIAWYDIAIHGPAEGAIGDSDTADMVLSSGGSYWRWFNCVFNGWRYPFRHISVANTTEHKYFGCFWKKCKHVYYLNELQSLNHNFYGCDAVEISGHAFEISGGGSIHWFGGSFVLVGSGSLLHFSEGGQGYAQNSGNISFSGIRVEFRDSTKALSMDASLQGSAGPMHIINFSGSNLQVTNTNLTDRDIWHLASRVQLNITGSNLGSSKIHVQGHSNETVIQPGLRIRDSRHFGEIIIDGATTPARRPFVSVERFDNTASPGPGLLGRALSFQIGPRTNKGLEIPARTFTAYLSYSGTQNESLPPAGSSNSIVFPDGVEIVRISLVILQAQSGAAGTWTVTNGDGSITFISESYTTGGTAHVVDYDGRATLSRVSGANRTIVLNGTGFNALHAGYVEIEYR